VYARAAAERATRGLVRVVDVGCGTGLKLVATTPPAVPTLGIDTGDNLARARQRYPDRQWLDLNLDGPWSLATPTPPLVICADVLEHLVHPEHTLWAIRDVLDAGGAAVLSTPDRVRVRGAAHTGPPPNSRHVREWRLDEFHRLLVDAGLGVRHLTHTDGHTILAVVEGT
jgi:2-polyprenyl-3-methyl-5-hydroxy-6-metoxy-1,4-benzoquinol methylase